MILADSADPELLRRLGYHAHWYDNFLLGLLVFFGVNFLINSLIIFFIIPKNRLKNLLIPSSLVRIAIVSALGLGSDLFGGFVGQTIQGYGNGLDLMLAGLIIFVLVGLSYYLIYSKVISRDTRRRIRDSIIFSLISNPIWISSFILIMARS